MCHNQESKQDQRQRSFKGQESEETGVRRPTIRTQTEALLIRPEQGKTYVEILRVIQRSVKPEDVKEGIKAIRETKAGDVLV